MSTSQVAVATFTIIFEGLMTFVGPSEREKTHVAVVHETGHHKPQMVVNGEKIPLAKGDKISFSLSAGAAKTTPSFDLRVLSLPEFVEPGGDLAQGVKENSSHDHVVAMVTLPAGWLEAHGAFRHPASWVEADNTTRRKCVASVIRLQAFTSADTVTITIQRRNHDPIVRVVTPGSDVQIRNTARQDHEGPHFHHYAKLLTSGVKDVKEDKSCRCDSLGNVVDCGDTSKTSQQTASRTPRNRVDRTPSGDCGPTDWP